MLVRFADNITSPLSTLEEQSSGTLVM